MAQSVKHRDIRVSSQVREVTYMHLDKHSMQTDERYLGSIVTDNYDGEAQRLMFQPALNNPWAEIKKKKAGEEGMYNIGYGSGTLDFTNPADAVRLFMDRGFVVIDQFATAGGMQMKTILYYPERRLDDIITYDEALWSPTEERYMHPCVIVTTDLRVGHNAVSIVFGFFRYLCFNGMAHPLFGYGEIEIRHSEYAHLESIDLSVLDDLTTSPVPLGPEICSVPMLKQVNSVISNYHMSVVRGEVPVEFAALDRTFSAISPNALKPWVIDNFTYQMGLLAETREREGGNIYLMDVVCAYTGAINERRFISEQSTDRGVYSAFSRMDSVVSMVTQLAAVAALFQKQVAPVTLIRPNNTSISEDEE